MDLRLFHPEEFPNRSFKTMDRFNSWTRLQPCRVLEWTGWYYGSVPLRLLGHYRLFQLYKNSYHKMSMDIPTVHGYILQRRITYGLKYRFYNYMVYFAKIWGYPERTMEIYIINRMLLYERASILHDFLTTAEIDFEPALKHAIQQIHDPSFLSTPGISRIPTPKEPATPAVHANDIIRGKQKDVFSKKQVLILFDLLSQSAKIEPFDLGKPIKFDAFAQFLHALTGKSKETWLEELKNYRNKDLYGFNAPGELDQLLSTLTNLSNTLRKAGLRTLSNQADKKIKELEAKR